MLLGLMLAAVAAPTSAPTVQSQFEEATAAMVAQQWEPAAAKFHVIGERTDISQRTRSIVAMREGQALYHLKREDEATALMRKGLALASSTDPALREDRADSLMLLGGVERGNFDFAAARRDFEAARAISDDPVTQLTGMMALANVTMFDPDGAALGYMDEAVKFVAAHKVDVKLDAQIHDLRGEVLLNRGDTQGALVDLNIALKDLGGLTTKTDLDDVKVRENLVLAYLLAKNRDRARDFIGMTGEGRAPDNRMLGRPDNFDLPMCDSDIRPDDLAVVEFGIGDDGNVLYVQPVYASRPGPIAVDFARAVYGWSWNPQYVKNIPFFYRARARLELRCTMAANRPSPIGLLWSDVEDWLESQKTDRDVPGEARKPAALRAALAQREKKGSDGIDMLPLLVRLADSSATDFQEAATFFRRADFIAAAARAPTTVRTYFAIREAGPSSYKRKDMDAYIAALDLLLKSPAVQADARSAATLRLTIAQSRSYRDPVGATQYLEAISTDGRLDAHDSLKVAALLQLASIKAQQKDLVSARRLYDATGLDAKQCALVDAQPVHVRGVASEQDYPQEAREWGLSGWARTEFDVKADGTTANVRTVMAYPPFVFGPPIERVVAHQKYTQSYRPDGGLGCGGETYQQGFHYVNAGGD